MEEIRGSKGSRIRIILLKEAPPPTALYDHYQSRPPYQSTLAQPQPNRTSLAYLSSILQDEHLQTSVLGEQAERSLALEERQGEAGADGASEAASLKLEQYRRSGKKSSRYLSCLLETADEGEQRPHAKTEGMERLLQRRKILPIEQMQQRRKNITFSLKNKRELHQDFHEFVSKRAVTAAREEPAGSEERETIAFPMKPSLERRVASLRGEKRRGRRAMQHLQLLEPNLPLPPSFARKMTSIETKEPGYALAFKRLSSDIPQLSSFEWSRLDHHPYHLKQRPA